MKEKVIAPVIVLARPQMGENIGATARAMMNFGLQDLRLVSPRDGWPNPKAHEMAARAFPIIEQAGIYHSLAEALHDCQSAYAVSARRRDLPIPVYSSAEIETLYNIGFPVQQKAFVFGPENNGLSNEDIACCQGIITIPADPANTSLNLAQSVIILAYEWFQKYGRQDAAPPAFTSQQIHMASVQDIDIIYQSLIKALEAKNHFPLPEKRKSMEMQVRTMLAQWKITQEDVAILHSIIRSLSRNNT